MRAAHDDQATVSGGHNPTGTVTFNLYNNSSGTGTPLFTDTESLVNSTATSAAYTPTVAGTDYWVATYNGDTNNNAVTSGVASEPVTITAVPLTLAPFTTSDPCMIGPGSSPINITPAVTGGVPPYTFSIVPGPMGSGAYDVPGLPPGVMLNSSTGVISGSPTSSTDFSSTQFDFTVQVEDSTGATATANGVIVLDVCTPGR